MSCDADGGDGWEEEEQQEAERRRCPERELPGLAASASAEARCPICGAGLTSLDNAALNAHPMLAWPAAAHARRAHGVAAPWQMRPPRAPARRGRATVAQQQQQQQREEEVRRIKQQRHSWRRGWPLERSSER